MFYFKWFVWFIVLGVGLYAVLSIFDFISKHPKSLIGKIADGIVSFIGLSILILVLASISFNLAGGVKKKQAPPKQTVPTTLPPASKNTRPQSESELIGVLKERVSAEESYAKNMSEIATIEAIILAAFIGSPFLSKFFKRNQN